MSDIKLAKSRCPYPYCRSENVVMMYSETFYADKPDRPIRFQVCCKECGTCGPVKNDKLFATQGWNDLLRVEDDLDGPRSDDMDDSADNHG